VISSFHLEAADNYALLGCYVASSGNLLPEIGTIGCPETSDVSTTTGCVITQRSARMDGYFFSERHLSRLVSSVEPEYEVICKIFRIGAAICTAIVIAPRTGRW
jgi:hypothetical protein